jgi:hypothetical protein
MGHQRSRHGDLDGGSRIGARYRHTSDEMAARMVDAIEARLQLVLRVAEEETRGWTQLEVLQSLIGAARKAV